MPAADVVKKGAEASLTFRSNLVYEVRRALKQKAGSPAPTGAKRGPGRPPKAATNHVAHASHTQPSHPQPSHAKSSHGGDEQRLIGLVLEIGTRRVSELLAELRHSFEH